MAKVTYKRVATNDEVSGLPILDGQLIYTGQGKTYMDYETNRIPINGTTDTEMNDSSTNPVENRIIKGYVDASIQNIQTTIPEAFIMWTNPDPETAISTATEIYMNTDDYDMYEVVYSISYTGSTTTLMSTGKIPKGHSTRLQFCYLQDSSVRIRDRQIDYVNDNTMSIGTNISMDGDLACMPLYIIGYRNNLNFQ